MVISESSIDNIMILQKKGSAIGVVYSRNPKSHCIPFLSILNILSPNPNG